MGMSLRLSSIKTTKIDDFDSELGHVGSILQVRHWLESPGISGSELGKELERLLPEEGPYLSSFWRTSARKIADLLTGRRTEVLGETTSWVPVTIAALYRPQVPGAKATLSIGNSKERSLATNVEIFGTGGGTEFNFEVASKDSLETEDENLNVSYARQFRWQICRVHTRKGSTEKFARLLDATGAERVDVDPIPGDSLREVLPASPLVSIDLRGQKGTLTRNFSTNGGVQWKGKLGLSLEEFGVEATTEYIVTRKVETAYQYVLPAGFLYEVVPAKSPADWIWKCSQE